MALNSKEVDQAVSHPPRFTSFLKACVYFLSPFWYPPLYILAKIPFTRKLVTHSVGGINGQIVRSWNAGDYEKAALLAILALERFRDKKSNFFPFMDHHHWWSFMSHGVDCASKIDRPDLNEKLLELADGGIQPFSGYFVAHSYFKFSEWESEKQNYEQALKYTTRASLADPTWAWPDFILGWLRLKLEKEDALEHFERAVTKDPSIISRIADDPVCKEHPHILQKLGEKNSN